MIEVHGLTRYYGGRCALSDVSFSVSEGSIVGLLGLNGAGKSTTLKILAGLLPPTSGTVTIDGVDIVAEPVPIRKRIGYLPEEPPLYLDMRVADFVTWIGRLKGLSRVAVAERLPGVLETTQLTERRESVIGTLSHGFRKRVGIAAAIIHDPRLVILDEPISGLDPKQIAQMREVVRRLADGRAVLVSSHILSEVEATCDRLIVLHEGRLVRDGSEADIVADLRQITVRVRVRGEQSALEAAVSGIEGVISTSPVACASGFAALSLRLENDTAREQVARRVLGAGLALHELTDVTQGLESAFLGMTAQGES